MVISDDSINRLRTESSISESSTLKISDEDQYNELEEQIQKTLKIGPLSVWALGESYIAPNVSLNYAHLSTSVHILPQFID